MSARRLVSLIAIGLVLAVGITATSFVPFGITVLLVLTTAVLTFVLLAGIDLIAYGLRLRSVQVAA